MDADMSEAPRDDDLTFVREAMGAELDTVLVFSLLRTHSYLGPYIDADLRRQNLTEVLATSCPYCITQFEDSRLTLKDSEVLQIKDITEILQEVI